MTKKSVYPENVWYKVYYQDYYYDGTPCENFFYRMNENGSHQIEETEIAFKNRGVYLRTEPWTI